MNLKKFIEKNFKKNPIMAMETIRDLIELEAIERNINVLWGVELDIKVKKAKKVEGRFYGKGLIEALENAQTKAKNL